jgi:hypothetical protein
METTPDSSPAKRSRAKLKVVTTTTEAKPVAVKTVAAKAVDAKATPVKKPRAARKTPTAKAVTSAEPVIVAATLEATPEDMGSMIATAAYYLAAARNFTPGHELDDWLAAERAIQAKRFG